MVIAESVRAPDAGAERENFRLCEDPEATPVLVQRRRPLALRSAVRRRKLAHLHDRDHGFQSQRPDAAFQEQVARYH